MGAIPSNLLKRMAGTTGLEPAASAVTGQRSNQLNYVPTRQINEMRNRQCLCGLARIACRAWNCLGCPKERASCPNRLRTASKFQHERSYTEFILPQRLERSVSCRPIPQRLHVPSKGCRVFITSPYELLPKSHQTKGILLATVNQKQRLLISTGGSYVKSAPRPGSETGVRSIQSLEKHDSKLSSDRDLPAPLSHPL